MASGSTLQVVIEVAGAALIVENGEGRVSDCGRNGSNHERA